MGRHRPRKSVRRPSLVLCGRWKPEIVSISFTGCHSPKPRGRPWERTPVSTSESPERGRGWRGAPWVDGNTGRLPMMLWEERRMEQRAPHSPCTGSFFHSTNSILLGALMCQVWGAVTQRPWEVPPGGAGGCCTEEGEIDD